MFAIVDISTSSQLASMTSRLEEVGIDSARREAEWLMMHVVGRTRISLITDPDSLLKPEHVDQLEGLLTRRLRREPIQYVLAEADFFGRTFQVTPAVLIPRPETEELVERVLGLGDEAMDGGVLDLGTGSGCIPITLSCERPGLPCMGVDLSADALEVAKANAARLDASVTWLEADMADPNLAALVGGRMSVVVSNPPYVPETEVNSLEPEVRDHEPHMALFSEGDALHFYRVIVEQAPRILLPGGWVLVEIHADGGRAVCTLFEEAGWHEVTLHADLAGRDRIVQARVG